MERLKRNIITKVSICKETGCWNFTGCVQSNGYARLTYKRKTMGAHRWSYIAFIGDIPIGIDVCHKCDNRKCVNPLHLFLGTRKENMHDAVLKGRQAKGFMLPQSKLSDLDKEKIMARVNAGHLYKDIAKDFNVHRVSIGNVARKNGVNRYEQRNSK